MKIVWEDETAVFLLLPALTFTAYNYTVEPPESYHSMKMEIYAQLKFA